MFGPLLSGTPSLVPVTVTHWVTSGGLLLVAIFLLVQDSLVWVLDTLYPWYQNYLVLEKRSSGLVLALWGLLFASSARSEGTSLTIVALARVGVSRLLTTLEMSLASRDPDVAAVATAYDMFFK